MRSDTLLRHCPLRLEFKGDSYDDRAFLRHGDVQTIQLRYPTLSEFQHVLVQIVQQPMQTVSSVEFLSFHKLVLSGDSTILEDSMDSMVQLFQLPRIKTAVMKFGFGPCVYNAVTTASHLTALTVSNIKLRALLSWLFDSRGPLFDHLRKLEVACV